MRKSFLPVLLAGSLAVSGCANPLGSVLGSVLGGLGGLGGGGGAYGNQDFQRAAVNSCGQQASRYGRVSVQDVQQVSNSTLRVYGTVDDGFQRRQFRCDFRSDGRISDFQLGR